MAFMRHRDMLVFKVLPINGRVSFGEELASLFRRELADHSRKT
jgi:hypothetical protein